MSRVGNVNHEPRITVKQRDRHDVSWMDQARCRAVSLGTMFPDAMRTLRRRSLPSPCARAARSGELERAKPRPEPIDHGAGSAAWRRCKRANGEACAPCKAGHATETALRAEAEGQRVLVHRERWSA